jgi:hypothetical protein
MNLPGDIRAHLGHSQTHSAFSGVMYEDREGPHYLRSSYSFHIGQSKTKLVLLFFPW